MVPTDKQGGQTSKKGETSVHDAGKKGGRRVRELVEEGKRQEGEKNS